MRPIGIEHLWPALALYCLALALALTLLVGLVNITEKQSMMNMKLNDLYY